MVRYLVSGFLFFFTGSFMAAAHLPYLDPYNSHNSYETAFEFKDTIYSRALCTTTTCPPRYYQHNKTSSYGSSGYYSPYTWAKVFVSGGESVTLDFGIPYIPALQYPPFRPIVYLLGDCIPGCDYFDNPKPQTLEYPPFELPYGFSPDVLRFNLADPGVQPSIFHEPRLETQLADYLNYTFPVLCDGDVYVVVESTERRIAEYFIAIGEIDALPPGEEGFDSIEDAKYWAQGRDPNVGNYCKRRGYYETE